MRTVRNVTFLFFVTACLIGFGARPHARTPDGCECDLLEDNRPTDVFLDCGDEGTCLANKIDCIVEYCGMCMADAECGNQNMLVTCMPGTAQ